jgi:hypothetical protein
MKPADNEYTRAIKAIPADAEKLRLLAGAGTVARAHLQAQPAYPPTMAVAPWGRRDSPLLIQ